MPMEERIASQAEMIQLAPPQQAPTAFRPASRRSSVDSQTSTVSIEPLRDTDDGNDNVFGEPGARMPRRRSSNISFEKHGSVVLEQLASLIDDDDDDDDNDDDEEGSLDGIPTAAEAPENPNEPSQDPLEDYGNRSQVSIDVNEVAVSVAGFRQRRRRSSASSAGALSSFNGSGSILGRIEDDIIEKGIRAGKLVEVAIPDHGPEENEEDTMARTGHESINSIASAASSFSGSRRRGSLGGGGRRRASFARRASGSSTLSGGGGRRRVSFAGSQGSSSHGRGGSFFRAGPSLQRDIAAAVRDLDDEDLLLADGDDDEEADDAAIARAVLATGGGNPGTVPSRRSFTVEVEMAVPPPRGAMPRRSSLKSPESRREWA